VINLDPIPMPNVAGYVGWDTVSNQVIEDRQVCYNMDKKWGESG